MSVAKPGTGLAVAGAAATTAAYNISRAMVKSSTAAANADTTSASIIQGN